MCVVRCDMSRFRLDPLQTLESHTWLLPAALSMGSGGGETGIPDRATPKGEASWRSVAADNPRRTPSCAVCVKSGRGWGADDNTALLSSPHSPGRQR